MNWKNLFFISTACWVGIFILANCTEKRQAGEVDKVHTSSAGVVKCPGDPMCGIISQQIAKYDSLMHWTTSKFETTPGKLKRDSITVNKDTIPYKELELELSTLRGFKYPLSDFLSIANYVKATNKKLRRNGYDTISSVYAMLALNTDPFSIRHRIDDCDSNHNSPCIKYTDIYFQAQIPKGEKINFISSKQFNDDGGYTDFPRPCPTACPDTNENRLLDKLVK